MKSRRFSGLKKIFAAAGLALPLFAMSVQADGLRVVTEEFPPYNYEEDGEAKGLSTEVVQAVLKEAGLEASITFYPWARAYATAQVRENTLIYSIARIPEREEMFEWVGVVAPYRTSFYKLKENDKVRINSIEEAREYRVGVSLEDVILTYLKGQGFDDLQVSEKDLLNVRMLARGRLDVIAYDEAAFPRLVQREGYDLLDFERVYRLEDLTGDLYIAASPGTDPAIVKKLKAGLEAVKASGLYDEIHKKYFLF